MKALYFKYKEGNFRRFKSYSTRKKEKKMLLSAKVKVAGVLREWKEGYKEYRKDRYGSLLPRDIKNDKWRRNLFGLVILLGGISKNLLKMEGYGLEYGVWLSCIILASLGIYVNWYEVRLMYKNYKAKKRGIWGGRVPSGDKVRMFMGGMRGWGGLVAGIIIGVQVGDEIGEKVLGKGPIVSDAVKELFVRIGVRRISDEVLSLKDKAELREIRRGRNISWDEQKKRLELKRLEMIKELRASGGLSVGIPRAEDVMKRYLKSLEGKK